MTEPAHLETTDDDGRADALHIHGKLREQLETLRLLERKLKRRPDQDLKARVRAAPIWSRSSTSRRRSPRCSGWSGVDERMDNPSRAEMCRVLASWVEDEYRALEGGHERQVELDDRGMFPDTLAP